MPAWPSQTPPHLQITMDCHLRKGTLIILKYMGQVMKVGLFCYLVLLSIDSKTRQQDSCTFAAWSYYSTTFPLTEADMISVLYFVKIDIEKRFPAELFLPETWRSLVQTWSITQACQPWNNNCLPQNLGFPYFPVHFFIPCINVHEQAGKLALSRSTMRVHIWLGEWKTGLGKWNFVWAI